MTRLLGLLMSYSITRLWRKSIYLSYRCLTLPVDRHSLLISVRVVVLLPVVM